MPDSCTLPTVEQPVRLAEFDRFFAEAVRAVRRPDPARLELVVDPAAEPVTRDLAARESSCCSVFTFDFDSSEAGLVMGVGVPAAYAEVLDALGARVDTAGGEGR